MASFFVKRSSGADNLLLFLVSAAGATLLTRFYLHVFDYPRIAQGNIHLAHAIFGGILLTISNILLLCFHGRRLRQTASVVAGLGFSQFIDEIGKFITSDNNYFYQPVPVIIYLSFIMLFFLYLHLDKYTPQAAKELVYEMIELLEEVAENRFHLKTKKNFQELIDQVLKASDQKFHPLANGLLQTLSAMPIRQHRQSTYVKRLQSSWKWLDDFTAERKPVFYFLLCIFLIYIINTFWGTFVFLKTAYLRQYEEIGTQYQIDHRFEWVFIAGELASALTSALIMARGFIYLVKRNRLRALYLFRVGLTVSILITYVFRFYFEQFSASIGLIVTLILFAIVHNILEEEKNPD